MINIIICEDDRFTLQLESELIKEAIHKSGVSARLACVAASGTELFRFLQNEPGTYLYFLDFDFGTAGVNGIDLVKRIYQKDAAAKVVFVTSHGDKGMDILKSGIQAFGFIEKQPKKQLMLSEYIRYLKMLSPAQVSPSPAAKLSLPIGIGETVELPVSDIAFVDSVKTTAHTICYHTFDGSQITLRDTIEHASGLLDNHFIRCHRSILVNKRYVISLKNGLLYLSNGASVPYAAGKKKEIMAACFSREIKNDSH